MTMASSSSSSNGSVSVLIVDDSLVFRHAVADALADDSTIGVIGSVRNGVKALEAIESQRPDLVTLDIEMPEMDGLQTLEKIQQLNRATPHLRPIGVIMLSGVTRHGADATIRALELGAFDFVQKPAYGSEQENVRALRETLQKLIHQWVLQQEHGQRNTSTVPASPRIVAKRESDIPHQGGQAIGIGVSTGGPKALGVLLPRLCEVVTVPIFVVQHMPPLFTASLAQSLNGRCAHEIKEAIDGDRVHTRNVYVAPGGRHLVVRRDSTNAIATAVIDGPSENGCRPSVDVLFRSLAETYGAGLVSVIMTGMGSDGALSLRAIYRAGGRIFAQDEESSVVWGMPGRAVETGYVEKVVSLQQLAETIADAVNKKRRTV